MSKRWINTKVEFIWDGSQYVEQSVDGYWYDGEMALCGSAGFVTKDGRETYEISANWDTFDVKGRVIDWGGSNLHIGYDVDHSAHNVEFGTGSNLNAVLVNTVVGLGVGTGGVPSTKLHVKGAEPAITIQNSNTAGNDTTKLNYTDKWGQIHAQLRTLLKDDSNSGTYDSAFEIRTAVNGALATRIAISEGGNIGINVDSPTNILQINGSVTDNVVRIENDNTSHADSSIRFRATNGANHHADFGITSTGSESGQFYFKTPYSGTAKMVIGSDGKVGIGTTAPGQLLHIKGSVPTIFFEDSTNGDLAFIGDSQDFLTTGASADSFGIRSQGDILLGTGGNNTRMIIDSSGNVGIGDTSPSYKLEVAGTFYASGSSQAFKKNVTDLAVDSSAIYNLNPVSYNYKKDYENFGYDLAEGKQFGLISEEVAKAVPELAIMKDGEPKNVDYQKLSVLLLAEMQKMNKRVEELECHI